MGTTDKLKQSLYFPEDMLREIMREANRLDRSLSWTMQQAWRLAREEVKKFPGVERTMQPERVAAPPSPPLPRQRPASVNEVRAERDRERLETGEMSSQVREFLRGKFDRNVS